ncbi:hypothetical protein MTO96_022627 [Rhipicephalus appendiculatus]
MQGWDDVSFHGSSQIPTPNLDALAADGVILNNYYAQPACTPSRAALMTGLYPIRTGLQGLALDVADPWGAGVGRADSASISPRPRIRNAYRWKGKSTPGLDFWLNMDPLRSENGSYSTTLYTERAKYLIQNRDKSKPLFLFLSHQAPHGAGDPEPLQAPQENIDKFPYIGEKNRTIYAGMVDALDQSVGEVVKALSDARMLQDTVIVFSSDNGGQPWGMHTTRSINWPLRGSKGTVWEGGTRVPAFVWSPLLVSTRRVSHQLMHITDWIPTLYSIGGGNPDALGKLDGYNMWEHLRNGLGSPRVEMLYNIDIRFLNNSALRLGRYKLVLDGTGFMSERFPRPGGSLPCRDLDRLLDQSLAAKVLRGFYKKDHLNFPDQWRERATLKCGVPKRARFRAEDAVHLFDIDKDPCELNNVASLYPEVRVCLQIEISVWYKSTKSVFMTFGYGIILNNYYTQPSCTPSRSAFLTGLYPIRTGLQGLAVDVADPWGLPLDVRLLPQYLKDIGYETHLVGKWDIGYYKSDLTPTCRGFDSFYGYYNGEESYYTHSITHENHTGLDFWLNREPLSSENGSYSTTLFTKRAQYLIRNRNKSKPFFLFLSHQSPHGAGEPEPLQAPKENVDKFPYIGEKNRTIYAGMVDALDQSVGEVFKTLSDARHVA